MNIDQPTNLLAFQWVAIVALISAVIYLYKAREADRDKCIEQQKDLLEKTLEGLKEVNDSLKGVADLIERWQEQFETVKAIERLAERLEKDE